MENFTPLHPLPPMQQEDLSFDLPSLFSRAFHRYFTHFVKYFLTGLLGLGIILAVLGSGFVGFLLFGIISSLFRHPLFFILFGIVAIVFYLAYFYALHWLSLAGLLMMTRADPNIPVWQNFKDTRKFVLPFCGFYFLLIFFFMGLTVYFYVLLLPWLVWGIFANFTFLFEVRGGLKPLWRSKELVKGDFWGIVGRLLIFLLIVVVFSIILFVKLNIVFAMLVFYIFLLFVFMPLSVAYLYEMYKSMTAKKPMGAQLKGGVWTILAWIGWPLLILVFIVLLLLESKLPHKNTSAINLADQSTNNLTQNSNMIPVSPTQYIFPTVAPQRLPTGPKTTDQKISTMEEALNFALNKSGMEYKDTARLSTLDVIYTPAYKQWKFTFISKTNPHVDSTGRQVFDFPETKVNIRNDGTFSQNSQTYDKNQSENVSTWSKLPENTATVATSSIFDQAKEKVITSGSTPGTILWATMKGYPFVPSGIKAEWKVNVILAGEEEKNPKKAKQVVFDDGTATGMQDVNVTLF